MLGVSEGSRGLGIRKAVMPLLFAAAIFYLGFQALSGERGLMAYFKESRKLELLQAELDKTSKQRSDIEHRVRLMKSSSLDLDLIDEQSRAILGVAGEGEVLYIPER